MLQVLEQLLILQDRDRKINYLKTELTSFDAQAKAMESKADFAKADAEKARRQTLEFESARKKLELDVEAKKQQIERYSLQQYQTKRNEEYRALAHEIELARKAIHDIEDRELDIMEQMEKAQHAAAGAAAAAKEARADADRQVQDLQARETNLRQELLAVESDRERLAAKIEESELARYERLRRNKGDKVLVGIEHGVCGGCHMRLPAQVLITCQAQQELAHCINCGRMLYYTRDMSLAATE
jgi:predicted  nucleic acid-binding Zn-ribbon protein